MDAHHSTIGNDKRFKCVLTILLFSLLFHIAAFFHATEWWKITSLLDVTNFSAVRTPMAASNPSRASTLNISSPAQSHGDLWRAIIIYEPNSARYLEIFHQMLFNSWLYILRVEGAHRAQYRQNATNIIDIIVVVSDDFTLFAKLPSQCRYLANMTAAETAFVHDREMRTQSMCFIVDTRNSLRDTDAEYSRMLHGGMTTGGYPFLNSIDCIVSVVEQYPDLYFQYDFIMRTDDDVFLTPFFVYTFPQLDGHEFVVGKGGYVFREFTRNQLVNVSSMLNLTHCVKPYSLCFNHGSTWYGPPSLAYEVTKLAISTNMYLLWLFDTGQIAFNDWGKGWWRGVTLLYAAQMAINDLIIGNESLTLKTTLHDPEYIQLDVSSTWPDDINQERQRVHIHVWQTPNMFSKYEWHHKEHNEYFGNLSRSLELNNWKSDHLQIREYCLAIAYDLHDKLSIDLFNVNPFFQ